MPMVEFTWREQMLIKILKLALSRLEMYQEEDAILEIIRATIKIVERPA